MNSFNRNNIFSSLIWKLLERGGAQGIQVVVQLILARLLGPAEFGTMAIVLVFVNLSRVFVEGGFNVALIQKKDTDDLDYSSIYVLSLLIATFLFLLLFFVAPSLARFYSQPQLTQVLRVSGVLLFPGALNTVQESYIARNLLFKKGAIISLIATIISGLLGIIVAYLNFGIWALILQLITYSYIYTYALQWKIDWKPKFRISWNRVKILFSYGSRILGSSLVYRLYLETRTLIIGKMFSSSALGFYQRGEQIPKVLVTNIDGAIQTVMLPTLSAKQDDVKSMKIIVQRALKISTFVVFPMMFGLAAISKPLIFIILGAEWIESISYLMIFSFTYALWPLITINQQTVRALGRGDIILKTEILKRFIGILIILISVTLGVEAIAWGFFFERVIETFVNAWPNRRLINYSYLDQIKDILPSLVQSCIMYAVITSVNLIEINIFIKLFLQISIGLITYIFISIIFKNESLLYLISIVRSLLKEKKKI